MFKIALSATSSVIAWLLGGILNLFVPSGGDEWEAIGDIIGGAAIELSAVPGKPTIAHGTGYIWTTMFQPFRTIPLLGLM